MAFSIIRILRSVILLVLAFCRTSLVYGKPFPGFKARDFDVDVSNQTNTRGVYFLPEDMSTGLWPKGIVYYRFEEDIKKVALGQDNQQLVRIAMDALQNATENCIKFVEDKNRKTGVIIYRSKFYNDKSRIYRQACESECIGLCSKIAQEIVMSPGLCQTENHSGNYAGIVAHEIMHALGFAHEFQRHDRNLYLRNTYQIGRTLPDITYNLTYNYKSIMNYDLIAFGVKAQPNPPMNPVGQIKNAGQVCRISTGDRNLIEKTYATECRADKKPRTFSTFVSIPGTTCNTKLDGNDIGMNDVGEMMS